jgi:hypothetical protein
MTRRHFQGHAEFKFFRCEVVELTGSALRAQTIRVLLVYFLDFLDTGPPGAVECLDYSHGNCRRCAAACSRESQFPSAFSIKAKPR